MLNLLFFLFHLNPLKFFFNYSCSICKMEIDHYKRNSNEDLEWVDITNNQEAIDLTSKSQ